MNTLELEKKLQQLGLTAKQSAIYLVLIEHGELRIQEISTLTKIPRTSIYENLKILQGLGLTQEIVEYKQLRIKAYPLHLLKHSFDEKILELQSKIQNINSLEEELSILTKSNPTLAAEIRYYKNISGARQIFGIHYKQRILSMCIALTADPNL